MHYHFRSATSLLSGFFNFSTLFKSNYFLNLDQIMSFQLILTILAELDIAHNLAGMSVILKFSLKIYLKVNIPIVTHQQNIIEMQRQVGQKTCSDVYKTQQLSFFVSDTFRGVCGSSMHVKVYRNDTWDSFTYLRVYRKTLVISFTYIRVYRKAPLMRFRIRQRQHELVLHELLVY